LEHRSKEAERNHITNGMDYAKILYALCMVATDSDVKPRKIRRVALPVDDDDAVNKRATESAIFERSIEIEKQIATLQNNVDYNKWALNDSASDNSK